MKKKKSRKKKGKSSNNVTFLNIRDQLSCERNNKGMLQVHGSHNYNGVEFRVSLRQQKTGGAVMRGTLSIVSQKDGRVMQLSGKNKTEILQKIQEERPDYLKKMEGKRIPELNMSTSVTAQSLDLAIIEKAISRASLRLYHEHIDQIHRELGEVARPETITPLVAAHKYVDAYMKQNHSKLNEKTYKTHRNSIIAMCSSLPNIPMAEITHAKIRALNLSVEKQKLLENFWLFCMQSRVYIGSLPFSPRQKKKTSPAVLARNAVRPDILSIDEQDELYYLLDADCNGGDCGTALQLWGGFAAKNACNFNWSELIWYKDHNDYARIRYALPDLVGATHDYTAPIFPAGALLLRKRYLALREVYDEESLKKMPIVSQIDDPTKAMTPDALVAHTTMRLHSIGLSYESLRTLSENNSEKIAISRLLLQNTYKNNVYYRCALEKEEGTAKFLCRESLRSNTTDDNYTCFSDEEAGERLHNTMSCLVPEEAIDVDDSPQVLPDGRVQHTYAPETTRQRVGHVGVYKLQPGEEIVIKCPHGVKGSVTTRAYNEDGTLRRKTPKRKSDTKE